jgi:hypothetical protein
MPVFAVNFDAFKFDKYSWYGRHDVPWLAKQVGFMIKGKSDRIPENQRKIVEFVCNLPGATRSKLEEFLFNKYQSQIYGSVEADGLPSAAAPPTLNPFTILQNWVVRRRRNQVTPRLRNPGEIWKVISGGGVHTPPDHRINAECYFQVCFECVWDPEHGIAVLFNDRGEPIALGGQGDHF